MAQQPNPKEQWFAGDKHPVEDYWWEDGKSLPLGELLQKIADEIIPPDAVVVAEGCDCAGRIVDVTVEHHDGLLYLYLHRGAD